VPPFGWHRRSYGSAFIKDSSCCTVNSNTSNHTSAASKRNLANSEKRDGSFSKERGMPVRDQLEALILQMYKSNILYSEAVREFKKRFILTVLQENSGNQCRAARQLGMHRNTLSRTISELKIDIRQLRAGVKRPPRSARPSAYDKKAVR
jgi:Fis family transcriptional regulator, factor for inversion stimulation protein